MRKIREIQFAGETVWLDPAGVIYLPQTQTLVFSDLHFEKGSFLGQSGAPIPRYDTRDTLERMQHLMAHYRPKQVVLLGDSFHDGKALCRLSQSDRNLLMLMQDSIKNWYWVMGNHDASLETDLPGQTCHVLTIGALTFSHEPVQNASHQVVGHYHPKLSLRVGGQRISGRAFLHDAHLLVMPAFGSYTGGLATTHEVFKTLFSAPASQYIIYKEQLWSL